MAAERIQELVAVGHTEAPEAGRMVLVLVEVERTLELEAERIPELEVEHILELEEAADHKLAGSVNNLDQH